jgi:hypothetical protein
MGCEDLFCTYARLEDARDIYTDAQHRSRYCRKRFVEVILRNSLLVTRSLGSYDSSCSFPTTPLTIPPSNRTSSSTVKRLSSVAKA